ncbi:hypothetical protein BC833DRAFT_373953 [Globomyces pollinis-pini]|nr:hypothetical protein BC833DRAFT_373953 [Globomyces pollinis-pini]
MKYACAFCSLTFFRSENRKQHQAVHTGSNHICFYCDRAFIKQDSLTRHFKIHESITTWNRDTFTYCCMHYIESTHRISPPGSSVITSSTLKIQEQPVRSGRSKRNQVMSIKHLVS